MSMVMISGHGRTTIASVNIQISLEFVSFFSAFMMVSSTQPETPPFD